VKTLATASNPSSKLFGVSKRLGEKTSLLSSGHFQSVRAVTLPASIAFQIARRFAHGIRDRTILELFYRKKNARLVTGRSLPYHRSYKDLTTGWGGVNRRRNALQVGRSGKPVGGFANAKHLCPANDWHDVCGAVSALSQTSRLR
jgi:hypothetical protein